jgi:scyllo-inositol 2-dehydrogenase (NADP+)
MRVVVVGLGVQGRKRLAIAGSEAVAVVDPVIAEGAPGLNGLPLFRTIEAVPVADYDAALVCTPDGAKVAILRHLLGHGKHLLVEKPLIDADDAVLEGLDALARANGAVCYTAYNHRFEPHIVALKELLDSGRLGKVYLCKFFYGNGTARDVRNSAWRDQGLGVFPDLGSHLLDWTLQLFGQPAAEPRLWHASRFENRSFDHFHFGFPGGEGAEGPALDYEMTLLSWKNTFRLDLFAEKGSAHIDCLCKWGPSTLTVRDRILPSGRPTEEARTLPCPDPTWAIEYAHFKALCGAPATNIPNDVWINGVFRKVGLLSGGGGG